MSQGTACKLEFGSHRWKEVWGNFFRFRTALERTRATGYQLVLNNLTFVENFSGENWPDLPCFMLCVLHVGKSCDTFHPPLVVGKENCYLNSVQKCQRWPWVHTLSELCDGEWRVKGKRLKWKFVQLIKKFYSISVIVGSFCTTYETLVTLTPASSWHQ